VLFSNTSKSIDSSKGQTKLGQWEGLPLDVQIVACRSNRWDYHGISVSGFLVVIQSDNASVSIHATVRPCDSSRLQFELWLLVISQSSVFKFAGHHAMKASEGRGYKTPYIPDFVTRWRWVVKITFLLNCSGRNRHRYSLCPRVRLTARRETQ
jgi:hypothetical protein